jgi:hypothetical protein
LTVERYYLGPAPADEECAQLGHDEYEERAKAECRQYIAAVRIVCGDPPEGARLKVVSQPHDFGLYWEVVVEFDPHIRAACEYAARCDAQAPTTWAAAGLDPPDVGRGR